MCLLHLVDCPAHLPGSLHEALMCPSDLILKTALSRCLWHEVYVTRAEHSTPSKGKGDKGRAISTPDSGLPFKDPWGMEYGVCPYTVIRHDAAPIEDEVREALYQAVNADHTPDRGCKHCWELIADWGQLAKVPSKAEKSMYLKPGTSQKRKYLEGADSDGELSFIGEKKKSRTASLRKGRSKAPATTNFTQSQSPIVPSSKSSPTIILPDDDENTLDDDMIPPRPDQINNSKSTDYEVRPGRDGRNWDPQTDKYFKRFGPPSTFSSSTPGKRNSLSPLSDTTEEEALDNSARSKQEKSQLGTGFTRGESESQGQLSSSGTTEKHDSSSASNTDASSLTPTSGTSETRHSFSKTTPPLELFETQKRLICHQCDQIIPFIPETEARVCERCLRANLRKSRLLTLSPTESKDSLHQADKHRANGQMSFSSSSQRQSESQVCTSTTHDPEPQPDDYQASPREQERKEGHMNNKIRDLREENARLREENAALLARATNAEEEVKILRRLNAFDTEGNKKEESDEESNDGENDENGEEDETENIGEKEEAVDPCEQFSSHSTDSESEESEDEKMEH